MDSDCLKIDELELDKACLEQPQLYFKWSAKLADAKLLTEEARNNFEVVKAESAREIRNNPAKFNLEKVTEGSVAEAVTNHPDVKRAQGELFDARHHQDVIAAMVIAIEQRKSMIQALVNLHGQNYFADPRITREGREAVEDVTKDRVRRLGHRLEDRSTA